jgi:fatty-acyl-CoA synthase
MFLADHARRTPDKAAAITAAGRVVTYAELDDRSNRLAHLLHARGLRRGDHIAIFMENNIRFMESVWAAFRSGLYITPINRFSTASEAAYIATDCQARALVSSVAQREVAEQLPSLLPDCEIRLMVDGIVESWEPYEPAIEEYPSTPLPREWMGAAMFYSSGTTGRPKGIINPLPDATPAEGFAKRQRTNRFGFASDTVYLSPAPIYHSAPFSSILNVQAVGGTAVIMEKFDAVAALTLIDEHRVTHSQWVPTMFVRMLALPTDLRTAFDFSSHRLAIHAAAPCPIEVKRQMIEWWGNIIYEFYSGTEGAGFTAITSEEWLAHPGSVGRAAPHAPHICDEDGRELPAGQSGLIYFEQPSPLFVYHNDDAKTRASRHPRHPNWVGMGDIGYVDGEGYLYLTDRKEFMIISGGVNIYPKAIEDVLIAHPMVADAAVVGVPDAEMGEAVKAVVEPRAGVAHSDDLAAELIAFTRERVAHYMVPRSVDFITEMPRLPTGKLHKYQLRERYWTAHARGPGNAGARRS